MKLIKPIQLGNKTFDSNLIQGPLAGYSTAPFRELIWQYGGLAFACSEMISAKTILHNYEFTKARYLVRAKNEGPLCYQLSANDPIELNEACEILTKYGADLIDLNCGCPVAKIRSKGTGSKLLSTPDQLCKLIASMRSATDIPISVKVRVDGTSGENFNADVIDVINESKIDFVVVHGRHWTERYDVECKYAEITKFVERINKPVIGNGDVSDKQSLEKMLATGCDGAMVSRAGVGRPWIFQELIAQMNNETFQKPDRDVVINLLIEHVQGLIELLGSEKLAILNARKFAKYYLKEIDGEINTDVLNGINQCVDLLGFKKIITSR